MHPTPPTRLPILVLLALLLSVITFAEKTPPTYPEEGKVIGTGINQVSVSRTYKVLTATKTYELDCGKRPPLFSKTPGECGGIKKLQIGDTIHFRLAKGQAYIPVPVGIEPSGEQKLRVLREELRPPAKPGDPAPHSPDANPAAEKP